MSDSSTSQPPLDRNKVRRSTLEELTNLPNMLTMMRIVLIVPVMILMLREDPKSSFYAMLLVSAAAVTDWLDGYLARTRGLESLMGKLLDPLADKLLVMAILIVSAELGRIPGWFVVLLLSREISVTALRALAGQEGLTIEVVSSGKFKTALQLCGLVGLVTWFTYPIDFGFMSSNVNFGALGFALLVLSMVFSLMSAFTYFRRFMGAIASQKMEQS